MIEKFLTSLDRGEAFFEGNVLFVPIKGEDRGNGVSVLDESIAYGTLEVKDPGVIDTAVIDYRGYNPLFVMDGEEIVGARQNRIFATSFLTERVEGLRVPVVCVEEGRWEDGTYFATGTVCANPQIRSVIATTTFKSLKRRKEYKPDQKLVWKEVRKTLDRLNVQSKTLSLHDVYNRGMHLFSTDYTPDEDTIGIMGFDGEGFRGMDVFSSHAVFKKLAKKIIQSYLMGSWGIRGRFPTAPEPLKEIEGLEDWKEFPSIGLGREYRIVNRNKVGKALVDNDKVVHLSIFRRTV